MSIIAEGRRINQTLTHQVPVTNRVTLGEVPNDVFLSSPETPPLEQFRNRLPIVYDQPLVENGQPCMETRQTHFQASAASPLISGAIGGFAGVVTGWIVGGLTAMLTQNPNFLLGGAALGLAGGATLGAASASGSRVRLVIREEPIEQRQMTGVKTRVIPGTLKGEEGYFHRFQPEIVATPLGTYPKPQIEKFRIGDSQ